MSGSATVAPVIRSLDGQTTTSKSASSLSALFEVDESLEIDDTDIDLIEPRSDLRWQTNGVLLPLDRPLPKVEDQHPQTTVVTPVVETVTPIVEAAAPVVEAVSPVAARLKSQELFAGSESVGHVASASPILTMEMMETMEEALTPAVSSTTPTPSAAPITTPAAPPIPIAPTAPMPPATPVVASAPVSDTHVTSNIPNIPATPASPAVSSAPVMTSATTAGVTPVVIDIIPIMPATATIAPIQETSMPVSPEILITDTALDIDDSEDDEYYDEGYDTERDRMSSPLFILIVLLVLIIQVIFVGWLVNTGFIDMSSCSSLFGD
jgi:hypothetical protein